MTRKLSLTIISFLFLFVFHKPLTGQGFTVSGTRLIDANGKEFILRGVNNPHMWFMNEAYNALDTIARLGTNCVRMVWETRGKVDKLEQAIKKCIDLEIIPMVELHDATGDHTTKKLMEMVAYYTREDVKSMLFKYEKYLLVNIVNEWGNHSLTNKHWRDAYRLAVDSLRAAGYKYTIVIDASGWGQKIDPILKCGEQLLKYDPKNNLLFSVHMYGSWNNPEKIKKKLKNAYSKNLPLIVGEFGYNFQEGNNNLGCKVQHNTILQVCDELGYGYLAWSWTGNNQENAWLDLVKSSDWSTFTWWGKEVYEGEHGITATAKKASIFND